MAAASVAIARGGIGERLVQAATPKEKRVDYQTDGRQREAFAYNSDFNEAHTLAYNAFIKGLESEIKTGNYTLAHFETEIGKEEGLYLVRYRVQMNDAPNQESRQTIVDMRGTILSGKNSEDACTKVEVATDNKIYSQNSDEKNLMARMGEVTDHFWTEEAESSFQDGRTFWCHKAVLIKGKKSE